MAPARIRLPTTNPDEPENSTASPNGYSCPAKRMGNPLVRSGRLSFGRFVGTCHVRLGELFDKVMKRPEVSIGDGSRQDSLDVVIARN